MKMKAKFTIAKNEKIILTTNYLTNGHWAITRKAATYQNSMPDPIKKLITMPHGKYVFGISGEREDTDETYYNNLITGMTKNRLGYLPIPEITMAQVNKEGIVTAFCINEQVGIGPKYFPLLSMGNAYYRKHDPIIITSGEIDDETLALVMPMKL